MNCASVQLLLSSLLDQELATAIRDEVDRHVTECATCRAALQEMKRLDESLRAELTPSATKLEQLVSATLREFNKVPARPRTRPWRPLVLALSSAAAGFLLALVLLPGWKNSQARSSSPDMTQPVAEYPVQLALAIGTVEIEDEGQWKPLATGARLQAGQRIRTLSKSRCELRSRDGSEIRLNHSSEVVVQSTRQFHLESGQVLSNVAADASPFQIKTNQTTVTALGTQFDLNCQPARTTLTVLEGKTQFTQAGKITEVNAGQQLRWDSVQGTLDLRHADYQLYQATNWVHEILVLKGKDNPELTRRINDVMATIGETKMVYLAEEEIRTLGDHCVVPLCQYLQSARSKSHGERRELAARIVADLAQPRSIGDLIALLTDDNAGVRAAIARGLQRLTKQDLGMSPQQWQSADPAACRKAQSRWKQWWSQNQDRYPVA